MLRVPISSVGPHGLFAATFLAICATAGPGATASPATPMIPRIATGALMADLLLSAPSTLVPVHLRVQPFQPKSHVQLAVHRRGYKDPARVSPDSGPESR